MTTAIAIDPARDTGFFGHPTGLYVCFTTELWERFSFYGMKYLLLLYLTKYHLFTDANGLEVLGGYAALVYATPVIGGLLADRYLGMRKYLWRPVAGVGPSRDGGGGRAGTPGWGRCGQGRARPAGVLLLAGPDRRRCR